MKTRKLNDSTDHRATVTFIFSDGYWRAAAMDILDPSGQPFDIIDADGALQSQYIIEYLQDAHLVNTMKRRGINVLHVCIKQGNRNSAVPRLVGRTTVDPSDGSVVTGYKADTEDHEWNELLRRLAVAAYAPDPAATPGPVKLIGYDGSKPMPTKGWRKSFDTSAEAQQFIADRLPGFSVCVEDEGRDLMGAFDVCLFQRDDRWHVWWTGFFPCAVGDICTYTIHTDRHAVDVINVSPNGKTITVRERREEITRPMKATPGGFAFIVQENSQRISHRDLAGTVSKFTARANGQWVKAGHPTKSPGMRLTPCCDSPYRDDSF